MSQEEGGPGPGRRAVQDWLMSPRIQLEVHRKTGVYNSSSSTNMQDNDAKENLQLEKQALKEILQSSWPPILLNICTGHQM